MLYYRSAGCVHATKLIRTTARGIVLRVRGWRTLSRPLVAEYPQVNTTGMMNRLSPLGSSLHRFSNSATEVLYTLISIPMGKDVAQVVRCRCVMIMWIRQTR